MINNSVRGLMRDGIDDVIDFCLAKKMILNVYIVHTPFQSLYCNLIAESIKQSEGFHIFITSVQKEIDEGQRYTYYLGAGLKRVIGLYNVRRVFDRLRFFEKKMVHYYVPHVHSILANHIYNDEEISRQDISVYYEGVALFRDKDFVLKMPRMRVLGRAIVGKIVGLKYKYVKYLMPFDLQGVVDVYSPVDKKNLIDYECNLNVVKLPKYRTLELSSLLFIGPKLTKSDFGVKFNEIKEALYFFARMNEGRIYIKPHYQTDMSMLKKEIDKLSISVKLLSRLEPLESCIIDVKPKVIFGVHFSSVFVNIALMRGDNDFSLYVSKKELKNWKKLITYLRINVY